MRPRDEDRERLARELQDSTYQALLRTLQQTHRFFRRFRTWADVIACMRNGTSTDPRKDEVLRPIFEAHAEDEDPRWRAVLLVIFWPGLASIHVHKRGWDTDPEERWQNVVWTFLKVVCRIDLIKRSDRLVQKVINDTVHHLHDEYRRAWNRTNREVTAEPDEIAALVGGVAGIDLVGIELREQQAIEIERLHEHLDAGRITEADYLLLVGTRVYGQSVADYAREANLDYQVAKKRRQRAEAVIRLVEKKARNLSPSRARDPPLSSGGHWRDGRRRRRTHDSHS